MANVGSACEFEESVLDRCSSRLASIGMFEPASTFAGHSGVLRSGNADVGTGESVLGNPKYLDCAGGSRLPSDVPGRSIGVIKPSSSFASFPFVVVTLLILGYIDRCLSFGCAIAGLLPGPSSSLMRLPPDSSEKDLNTNGLSA